MALPILATSDVVRTYPASRYLHHERCPERRVLMVRIQKRNHPEAENGNANSKKPLSRRLPLLARMLIPNHNSCVHQVRDELCAIAILFERGGCLENPIE